MKLLLEERLRSNYLLLLTTMELVSVINALIPWILSKTMDCKMVYHVMDTISLCSQAIIGHWQFLLHCIDTKEFDLK